MQADKMFKVFSRPQIELEDFLKFEKVAHYVKENNAELTYCSHIPSVYAYEKALKKELVVEQTTK